MSAETTEEFKRKLLARVREGYMPNAVKAYKRVHGIPQTGRKNAHPERDIQNACLEWLTLHKICHVRLAVNSSVIFVGGRQVRLPNPMRGWPDILAIARIGQNEYATPIGLEIKAETRQSDEQVRVQKYIEDAGGLYAVIHSVEELENFLKPLLAK